jgi:ABC-2 type transport system permease protein
MVYEALKTAIVASVFIGLIIGADSLSGERERATLEGLLLTPTSRREIVVGKFLAAASPWPVALVICVPYLKLLSQGTDVFGPAVLWGAILGSLLAPAFTGLGMLVSFWSNTNKTSMFVSLGLYIVFLLPTQLPGHAQAGTVGRFFQWVNPMQAPNFFLAKFLVNNRTLGEIWHWLTMPFVLTVIVFGLLFLYAGPGLRLEAGTARRLRWPWSPATNRSLLACALGFLVGSPLLAQEPAAKSGREERGRPALEVSIDMAAKAVQAGSPVLYNTVVTNMGSEPLPPMILAMNIINLDAAGEVVDPEDWSPQRTQYLDKLGPGESFKHSWRVNAILDGDFMVYMVVIPAPAGPEATSQPVASAGIHLTVTPFTQLNPGGVLPYAIGGPVLVALAIFVVYRIRRRGVDSGEES